MDMNYHKKGGIVLNPETQTIDRLREFFQTQKLTALATQEPGHPYLSLMAFALTDDLNYLISGNKTRNEKIFQYGQNPRSGLPDRQSI